MLLYLLNASLVLTVLYGVYRSMLQQDALFVRNRVYLLLSLVLAFVLPLLPMPWASAAEITAPIRLEGIFLQGSSSVSSQPSSVSSSYNWVVWVYCIGVLVVLARTAVHLFKVLELIYSYKATNYQGVRLIRTKALPTSSFGPFLFWNVDKSLDDVQTARIFRHEAAHIRQRHSYDLLLAELACALLWFNPISWWVAQGLRDQHEFLADRAAAGTGDPRAYGKQLVSAFLEGHNLQLTHGLRSSQLQRRLRMLGRTSKKLQTRLKPLLCLPVVALLAGAVMHPNNNIVPKGLPAPAANSTLQRINQNLLPAEPVGGWSWYFRSIERAMEADTNLVAALRDEQVSILFSVEADGELGWVGLYNAPNNDVAGKLTVIMHSLPIRWRPARREGQPVAMRFTLPVTVQ